MRRSLVCLVGLWCLGSAGAQDPAPYDPWQFAEPSLAMNAHVVRQPLPVTGEPHGLAVAGDTLWLGIDDRLLHLRAADLKVIGNFEAPAGIVDLSADDRFLYAVTEKGVVHVIDPQAGRSVRQLTVPVDGEEQVVRGLACHGDDLLVVVEGVRSWILRLTKSKGDLRGRGEIGHQSPRLLASASVGCAKPFFDVVLVRSPIGKWEERVLLQQRPKGLAVLGAEYLVVVGEDDEARARHLFRLRPAGIPETLSVKIECTNRGRRVVDATLPGGSRLEGHAVRYVVGPKWTRDLDGLRAELERVYQDKSTWYEGAEGELKPMPLSIIPGDGVVLGDIAPVAKIVAEIGFREVFGVPPELRN